MSEPLLKRLYAPCPPPGEGCHQWLYGAACSLIENFPGIADEVAIGHMAEAVNRPLQPREASDAIAAARRADGDAPRRPKMPRPPADVRRITSAPVDASRFMHGRGVTPRQALLALVCCGDPSALVCVAQDARTARTAPLSGFTDDHLAAAQFVVPAPMRALTGTTKAGRHGSPRCHDNVGERVWWVFDFDHATTRSNDFAQASAILDRYGARVGIIVQTRGKGVHAWVRRLSGDTAEGMSDEACRLGCDPTVIEDPAKLVRMPGGTRPGAGTQFILHYNPAANQLGYLPDETERTTPDAAGVVHSSGPF